MVPLPCSDSHTWEALRGRGGRSGGQKEREKVNKGYLMSGMSRFRCWKGFHLLHEIRVQVKSSRGSSLRHSYSSSLLLLLLSVHVLSTFLSLPFLSVSIAMPSLEIQSSTVQEQKCGPLLRPDRSLGSQSSS